MGASDGGVCDTEGTVAPQGVCGRDPCKQFPLGDERFTGSSPPPPSPPPTPLKQKQAPPLIVTMLCSTTDRVHSDRWVRSYLEEGVRKVLCG